MTEKSIKILLSGGGTAGHVMPHLATLEHYKALGWKPQYMGSRGMERELVQKTGLTYHTIAAGKLRRYFSWENFLDLFRVLIGIFQAYSKLGSLAPDLVFCTGGYVCVPVGVAARLRGIPLYLYEPDLTPGLANRILIRLAKKIFFCFPETKIFLPKDRALSIQTPVRSVLFHGEKEKGRAMAQLVPSKLPTLLVLGGSLGAESLNEVLKAALPQLLKSFQVLHISGRGKTQAMPTKGYAGFDYVEEGMEHLFALADFVLSRAGANSIFELLALKKPMLLVPLEVGSRGDQLHNAESFLKRGFAHVLREKDLTDVSLLKALETLQSTAHTMTHLQAKAGEEGTQPLLVDQLQCEQKRL